MIPRQSKKVGLIFAGGQAKRFGGGKCHALLEDRPLIEHVYRALRPLVDELWLSTKKGYFFPELAFARVIEDEVPFEGPARALLRILSSLHPEDLILAAACDQPFLNPSLLSFLLESAENEGALAVMCLREDGKILPLPGVYRRGLTGGPSFRDLAPRDRLLFLSPEQWRRFDPDGQSFFNVNFREDLERACRESAKRAGE